MRCLRHCLNGVIRLVIEAVQAGLKCRRKGSGIEGGIRVTGTDSVSKQAYSVSGGLQSVEVRPRLFDEE